MFNSIKLIRIELELIWIHWHWTTELEWDETDY